MQKLCRGVEELQLIFRSILEKFESQFFLQTGINFTNAPEAYEDYLRNFTPQLLESLEEVFKEKVFGSFLINYNQMLNNV